MTISMTSAASAAVPMGTAARYAGRLLLSVFSVTTAILLQRDVADQGQMVQFVKDLTITGSVTPVICLGASTLGLDAQHDS
jgi:uncharacterized membrane protein YphA (DoxX/SURF4 family)